MSLAPRESEGFGYYGADSKWINGLFTGGYEFLTPPPEVTKEGIKPYPSDGARKLNARTWFFYSITGITPAMCMRLENVGSQYLMTVKDSQGNAFDGGKTYKATLPPKIPAARFWSFTVYDNQSRSMLDTRSAIHARGARVIRHPPPRQTRTGRQRFTLARHSPPASSAATGSRPIRRRAGSRSCACTARSSRSSTRSGARVEIELVK